MTEEKMKQLVNDINSGITTGYTNEELLWLKAVAERNLSKAEAFQSTVTNSIIEHTKTEGAIPFEVDGKSKEYYYKETSKPEITKEGKVLIASRYPTLVSTEPKLDEAKARKFIVDGSITDADILSEITYKVTSTYATRSVKKSKKTTTVVEEGGDE